MESGREGAGSPQVDMNVHNDIDFLSPKFTFSTYPGWHRMVFFLLLFFFFLDSTQASVVHGLWVGQASAFLKGGLHQRSCHVIHT